MWQLTPCLLEANDVYATHGRHLNDFTDAAVHGIDLCRIDSHQWMQPNTHLQVLWYQYLLQDGGIGGQHNVVLDESHTGPSGRPQLLLHGVELITLQLKVALAGSFQGAGREVQLPVQIQRRKLDKVPLMTVKNISTSIDSILANTFWWNQCLYCINYENPALNKVFLKVKGEEQTHESQIQINVRYN